MARVLLSRNRKNPVVKGLIDRKPHDWVAGGCSVQEGHTVTEIVALQSLEGGQFEDRKSEQHR